MKNIYLCQFSIINEQKFVLLPYSAGMIQAYAQSIDSINREYQFHSDIFFIPDKKENIINQIINPHIVGFGVYIWNLDFSDSIAKEIKKKDRTKQGMKGERNKKYSTKQAMNIETWKERIKREIAQESTKERKDERTTERKRARTKQ